MEPGEKVSLDKMRKTFPQLEGYGLRLREHLYPELGSLLALDDEAVPRPMPLSQHVWSALSSGYDHLSCISFTIEHKRLFTTATGTLARGGLLASSHALWLLLDDDAELRRRKSRRFSQEWLYRRIEWQTSVTLGLTGEDRATSETQLKLFEEDMKELTEGHSPLGGMRPTDVILEAATYALNDQGLIDSAMSEWNRLSGDAHALGWPTMLQSTTWGETGPDGLTQAKAVGSIDRLANAYLAAFFIYERAWARLWDLGSV